MKSAELLERRDQIAHILKLAGEIMMEGYARVPGADRNRQLNLSVGTKGSFKDLVTVYDKKVEEFIVEKMKNTFPNEPVIGEEATSENKTDIRKQVAAGPELFWVVDPIDGTTNFSRAYPFFCSTAALLKKLPSGDCEVLVGATWDPVREEMFCSSKEGGAWLNRERLRVTQVSRPEEALLTTGFAVERNTKSDRSFDLFKKITRATLGVRRDGAAALDLAYVACGRIDAYWEWSLSPWDIASGISLVSEAGGKISNLKGNNVDILSGEIVSSNGILHSWLLERIEETG